MTQDVTSIVQGALERVRKLVSHAQECSRCDGGMSEHARVLVETACGTTSDGGEFLCDEGRKIISSAECERKVWVSYKVRGKPYWAGPYLESESASHLQDIAGYEGITDAHIVFEAGT